jgi:hypothetical protein
VECGADKGGVFDTVLLERAAETGAVGGLSVYVGDSASDLAALTAADVGVVVGRNALLRRICANAGLRLLPLTAGERCFISSVAGHALQHFNKHLRHDKLHCLHITISC